MNVFNPIRKSGRTLLFWQGLALILCLMPGPSWWVSHAEPLLTERTNALSEAPPAVTSQQEQIHDSGQAVLNWCEKNKSAKQWTVHFILMFGMAFSIARQARPGGSGFFEALIAALATVAITSTGIEGLQQLLPASFVRGFATSDIWVSCLGGAFGTGMALGACIRNNSQHRLPNLHKEKS